MSHRGMNFCAQSARRFTCLLLAALVAPTPCEAVITGATNVAHSLSQPVFVTHAPGDTERLFIVEKGGRIKLLDLSSNAVLPTPFLTVPDTDAAGEGGLLGLAFHPDYAANGKLYVCVTVDNGGLPIDGQVSPFSTRVREYTVSANPNVANETPREVLNWVQPRSNHNGGWIGFGPHDDFLYIASGDGGKQGDPDNNAQTLSGDLLGKVLRIGVDGDDFPDDASRNYAIPVSNPFVDVAGDDEIWSYGLRNPWRASFDRQTGDLWIGDVGQGAREEIDFQAGDSLGRENYAWNRREGLISHQGGALLRGDTEPVYDYLHGGGALQGNSVTGGYVYRGPDPTERGQYFFGDFISSHVWTFDPADPGSTVDNIDTELTPNVGAINSIASFGEDADGNLYIVDYGGEVFRIDTAIQITGDYDGSGSVDQEDYAVWRSQYGQSGVLTADGNGDQVVDAADYTLWRDNLGRARSVDARVASVPEPAALAGCLLCCWWMRVRRLRLADRGERAGRAILAGL